MATAPLETVVEQVKEALPQITHALTIAGEQEEKQTSQNDREENLLTINGGVEEVFELFHERGWTDGFPIIPPTEINVRAMLSQSVYSPDTTLGLLPPAMNPVTVDKLAVNAVMAGCVPEYFPVILAAVEGLLDEDLALYSMQTATNATTPLIIVNGPIVKILCLNAGGNLCGPGSRANATIGRAVQLVLRNIGGDIAGETDMATHGQAGKFSSCIA